jgi:predicted nucleic acid-binding protein
VVSFWDTSAILPLAVTEPGTALVRPVLDRDPAIAVWWATRVECVSALARREREHRVDGRTVRAARRVLTALAREWTEVIPTEPLRKRAERLLATHAVRAADALQLAAALLWARDDPAGNGFVCLDERLREAAGREGFQVLPEP